MKRYKCHKVVEAGVIESIDYCFEDVSEEVHPPTVIKVDGVGYRLERDWIRKHAPEVGGYYVRYQNGYTSYSPAEAFEEGYTLLESDATLAEEKQQTLKDIVDQLVRSDAETRRIVDVRVQTVHESKEFMRRAAAHSDRRFTDLQGAIVELDARIKRLEREKNANT